MPAPRVQTVRVGKLCIQASTSCGQIKWCIFGGNKSDSL